MVNKWIFLTVVGVVMLLGLALLASLLFSSNLSIPSGGGKIAHLQLTGEITANGDSLQPGSLSATEFVNLLDQVEKDSGISVVLIEINSPGGSVVATKQIVDKIRSMKKPTVSWISDLGASGAYYAASATTYAMADEDSLTGSIGVIAMFPDVSGLLADYHVKMNVLKQGDMKDLGSPFKELTPDEKALFETAMKQIFENFKKNVQAFRGSRLDTEKFNAIADGRILTGQQALEVGLIDAVGGKQKAIDKAAELGKIEGQPELKNFTYEVPSLANLFANAGSAFGQGFKQSLGANLSSNTVQTYLK